MLNRVMEDESAIPFLEDEAIEFDSLLVDPQDHHISVDGFLCFRRNSPEKCVQMEDVTCKFGGKFSLNWEEEHLLGQEELDIMPSEHESGEFQAPKALFTCEDFLLDIEAGESITKLDYHLAKGSQNLLFESCTQANRAGYGGTPQELGLSCTINQVHDYQGELDMNDYDSNGIFSCSADSEMSIEDRWFKYPTSFPVESIEKLEDVSSMFSDMNEKSIIFDPGLASEEIFCPSITEQQNECGSVGQNAEGESNNEQDLSRCPIQAGSIGPQAEKRSRKPPHRYIDEISQPNSRLIKKRREVSTPTSKAKSSKVKNQKCDDVKSTVERSFPEESAGKAIQVPFGPLICKESQKKQVPVVSKVLHSKPVASVAVPEEDCVSSRKKQVPIVTKALHSKPLALVATSEEDCVSVLKSGEDGGRRKHHILWTVSEVKKLIDGVSQYGVGRWSHIKKDLFSSSAHRTAVDLKDKWRNLLKATCVQNEGKRGEDKKRNLAWRPLPKSVIRRVRELAIMYPYPRDSKPNISTPPYFSLSYTS